MSNGLAIQWLSLSSAARRVGSNAGSAIRHVQTSTMNLDDLTAKVQAHCCTNAGSLFILNESKRDEQGFNIVSRQICARDIYRQAGLCLCRVQRNVQCPIA